MKNLLMRGSQGADVARLRAELARQLGGDAADFPGLAKGDVLDAACEAAIRRWQSGVGLIADGVIGPLCQSLLGLRAPPALEVAASFESVRLLFPATKPANVARYLPYVVAALDATGLRDRPMVCAALGTIRAESEGFVPIAELPSRFNTPPGGTPFAAYETGTRIGKMLGNTGAGDGALFKGRGFVQLTGRANYTAYGKLLGIALADQPDLANAPEVAALLLAAFLAHQAKAMRPALARDDLAAARRLVNGGSHGLDRFGSVFELARTALPEPVAHAAARAPSLKSKKAAPMAAGAAPATAGRRRSLTVRKDPTDLRDRPYVPPPVSLLEEFPPAADMKRYLPRYSQAGLILNQGQQGACTGFGLACVVNYLRWRKAGIPPKLESVSAAMFYNFARRYDEYAGEDYDGSSCRGALKGWFNHGVCLEGDWDSEQDGAKPRYGYAQRAAQTTLGVYLRIDLGSITDLQAAIQEVGAVYVSAFTHGGWDDVPSRRKPPEDHAALPLIPWDGRPSKRDGHAFALVGFNSRGFIVQNSWGAEFGLGGFALLSYGDWLANAMDAWAVAIGVPGVVVGRVGNNATGGTGSIAGGGADTRNWWSEDQAYRHSVVFGNDGRIGRYLTEDEPNRSLLHQVAGLPDQWFRTQAQGSKKKRLVIYAHGGLNSEADAIQRARALGRYLIGNDCYPLFLVWKTGMLESIGNIVSDAFRKQPTLAGAGLGEMISERTDLLIEKTIGRPLARPIWSEMKENAELTFGSGRGGDLLITALQKLADTWGPDLELHFMGHSAGSIILGHLLTAMAARRLANSVASIHLYAPACTVQFANRHYTPHVELMKRLYLHVLSDGVERDDNVAAIYRKSLLYFVSNALEVDLRTPILGLSNVFDASYAGWDGTSSVGETLKNWRDAAADAGLKEPERLTLVKDDKVLTAKPDTRIRAGHGSFDNDITVIGTTIERILGGPLLLPVEDLRGF